MARRRLGQWRVCPVGKVSAVANALVSTGDSNT